VLRSLMRLYLGCAIAVWLVASPWACCLDAQDSVSRAPTSPSVRWRDASVDQYRQHLDALMSLVAGCEKGRNLAACDPTRVGPDDRLPLMGARASERRLVRYGWLRVLLFRAADPDAPEVVHEAGAKGRPSQESAVQSNAPSTGTLLIAAQARLAYDKRETNTLEQGASHWTTERAVMQEVLDGKDFRGVEQLSASDSLKEKLSAWLNRWIERAARLRAGSAWVGRVVVASFLVVVSLALIWALLILERRWRRRFTPEREPAQEHVTALPDWHRWLEDSHAAAERGSWRQAIHAAYWTVVARMESQRIWSVDPARTPRERLALIAEGDARKGNLILLTKTFESTWYGGWPADEAAYRQADALASALVQPAHDHQGVERSSR
jgi:hypothetical protein